MSDRLNEGRFLILRHQVRTSTGYTHTPDGVIRLPAGWGGFPRTETPVVRDITIAPKPKKSRRRKIKGDA